MSGTHKATGFLLLVLVLIRVVWAWANRGDRPPSLNALAPSGHRALYVLLIVVPLLALAREYGSGDSFSPFGLPLVPGFDGDEINWMTAPGNILHSWLGWLLLVLIVGHVSMVFVHRRRPEDPDVLKRMLAR